MTIQLSDTIRFLGADSSNDAGLRAVFSLLSVAG